MKILSRLLILVSLAFGTTGAMASDDKAAVNQAVTDYVMAFYLGKPELLEKVLHPTLRKIGWRAGPDGAYGEARHMSYEQALDLAPKAAAFFKSDENSPYEVTVFEVMDKTASAKVTALWGMDYFHLQKDENGDWVIYNIIWQTVPAAE